LGHHCLAPRAHRHRRGRRPRHLARITYRVAVGPEGGEDQRIFAALNPILAMESSLIRLVAVPTSDPHATARALDAGEVDLAVIRPDLAVPANGRTIAILRQEPILLMVPANGTVEKVADLKGKAIGLVKGGGSTAPFSIPS
jgi:TRAP-type uncharacterized transport system substrate-binding protein